MTKSAIIRCDASPTLGGGHVMRCLTLADAMAAEGYAVRFACAAGSVEAVPALARSRFETITLVNPLDPAELLGHLAEDVQVAVIDHYGIDAAYERALRARVETVVVIDDLADRPHDCNILVDQNFGREAVDYAGLVPEDAAVLAGAQYAMLRPEFAHARKNALARRAATGKVGRILVSMGMTDIGGITAQVLDAVLSAGTGAAVDVVLGSGAPSLDAVRAMAERRGDVAVHVDTADMSALMATADLAVGAAGSTSWERCCLGLPTVALVLADNQRRLSRALADAGVMIAAGSVEEITAGVARLGAAAPARQVMSGAAAGVTDGEGVARVVRALGAAKSGERRTLRLRPATTADAEALWKWRNDAAARASFRNTGTVGWTDHLGWLESKLADEGTLLRVAELSGAPAGVIRFDRGGQTSADVSINVDAAFRSKGFGQQLLAAGCAEVSEIGFCATLRAEIRVGNRPSRRIFEQTGFRPAGEDGEMMYLERHLAGEC